MQVHSKKMEFLETIRNLAGGRVTQGLLKCAEKGGDEVVRSKMGGRMIEKDGGGGCGKGDEQKGEGGKRFVEGEGGNRSEEEEGREEGGDAVRDETTEKGSKLGEMLEGGKGHQQQQREGAALLSLGFTITTTKVSKVRPSIIDGAERKCKRKKWKFSKTKISRPNIANSDVSGIRRFLKPRRQISANP